MDKNILKNTIKKANIQYRIGEPIKIKELPKEVQDILEQKEGELTDKSYDFLLVTLYGIVPNDEIFDDGIIESWDEEEVDKIYNELRDKYTDKEIADAFIFPGNMTEDEQESLKISMSEHKRKITISTRKEPLDKPMYSLDKMKSVPEVVKWAKKKGLTDTDVIIATGKYDGVSSLNNEKTLNAHSRGDGIDGQNITDHINKYNDYKPASFEFYTIGELIIPKQVFIDNDFVRDNGEPYKNPRNTVAGLVNNDEVSPYWKFVDHVRYGIADEDFEYDKLEHIKIIKKETGFDVPYEEIILSGLTTEKLDELYYRWGEKYEIDGIVLDVNDKDIRKRLGRERNNNPAYAIAYKSPLFEEHIETIIVDIEWNISKQQYLKPIAIIKPVNLGGVTITRVTLNNAKYVMNNNIGIGSYVLITRSGQVIPKIIKVLKSTGFKLPQIQNSEIIWNDTNVELMLKDSNDEVDIKKIVSFFEILDTDFVSEGIVRQLYDSGYTTIKQILYLSKSDLEKIDRFGKIKSAVVYNSIKKSITNIELSKLQHASNLFKNLGSKKLKLLEHFDAKPSFENIISIDGFSDISAKSFLNSYDEFYDFIKDLPITIKEKNNLNDDEFKDMSVVFTGVRRKDLSDYLESKNGKVLSGISKNVTHLVCKDTKSNSSKMQKARSLGIKILSVEEFEKLLNH